jgi:hypothetical protein
MVGVRSFRSPDLGRSLRGFGRGVRARALEFGRSGLVAWLVLGLLFAAFVLTFRF